MRRPAARPSSCTVLASASSASFASAAPESRADRSGRARRGHLGARRHVWTGNDEAHWLGWLDEPLHMQERSAELPLRRGSPERSTTSSCSGWAARRSPRRSCAALSDATGSTSSTRRTRGDPRLAEKLDLERTLFVSSSKSGTTLETRSHTDYFWEKSRKRARCSAAITDPGSELEHLARERGFRAVFAGEPSIGGATRRSRPSGSCRGADGGRRARLLERARGDARGLPLRRRQSRLRAREPVRRRLAGRPRQDLHRPNPHGFGLWAEQLIAESTGKQGKGLVPAPGESPDGPDRQPASRAPATRTRSGRSSSAGSSRSRSPAPISRSTRSTSPTCRRRRTRRTRSSSTGKEPSRARGLDRRAARAGAAGDYAASRRSSSRPPKTAAARRRASARDGLVVTHGLRPALPALDRPAAQGRPARPASSSRSSTTRATSCRSPASRSASAADPRAGGGRPRDAEGARPPRSQE